MPSAQTGFWRKARTLLVLDHEARVDADMYEDSLVELPVVQDPVAHAGSTDCRPSSRPLAIL
jgi:hypothetical protein